MDTETFDRLVHRFGTPNTRRSALGALFGTALTGFTLGTALAKEKNRKGKHRGKRAAGKDQAAPLQAQKKEIPHCFSPSGTDLNDFYDISEQIVAPFCQTLNSGRQWVPTAAWFMNTTFAEVPPEFEPAGATPAEDIAAKLSAIRYVIDPGTKKKKTVVFTNTGNLFIGLADDGTPVANTITLGALKPVSVGEHAVEVYWNLSAMHCDGLGADPAANCLGPGEVLFDNITFSVVPGNH